MWSSKHLLIVVVVVIGLAVSLLWNVQSAIVKNSADSAAARLGLFLTSRVSASDVTMFADKRYMHGTVSFRFDSTDEGQSRLIELLDLKRHSELPESIGGLVDFAKSNSGWSDFDWNTDQVYLKLYCRPIQKDFVFDIVLIDGTKVVYMTPGYFAADSVIAVDNLADCPE